MAIGGSLGETRFSPTIGGYMGAWQNRQTGERDPILTKRGPPHSTLLPKNYSTCCTIDAELPVKFGVAV